MTGAHDYHPATDQAPPASVPLPADTGGFVNIARLELDELLEQLIGRAHDVQATQGRLRGLLRAYLEVAATVDLDDVLAHILNAARTLGDARYAALGVVEDGHLTRFLHLGMDSATIATIGHLPAGKGLLGKLIDDPTPLRLADVRSHVASSGFPEGHPPMRSFLGVPIRTRRKVFGNIYLADKHGADEFSADDEELVTALAAAAGTAIDNAALFTQAHRRQQWQTAMQALSTDVLTSDDPADALEHIARHASEVAGAAGVSVCVPADEPGMLRVAAAEGIFADQVAVCVPVDGTVYGHALATGKPVVIINPSVDPRTAGTVVAHSGAIVAIPMVSDIDAGGVLFLSRRPDQAGFEEVELEMLTVYGAHAALMLQLACTRHATIQWRAAEDRKQIADDLQARVIEHLFRLGLDLHAILARIPDGKAKAMLNAGIDNTDAIIRELREAVFDIRPGT